jgi:tetratricopeptide (TPR) repeat protein
MCLSLRRHRQVFFWLAFFFIGLLPVMTPWGISWLVAERYVYLSAIGIFVVIGLVFDTLGQSRILRLCSNIVFSLLLIFLTARTILRNLDWVNEDSLWFATTRVSPASPNAHNNLGDVYSRQGELEKAAEEFRQAIKIDPGYAEAHHNLAVTYRLMGRAQDAIKGYLTAITLNPRLWQSYENLAGIYFDLGNFRMAKALLLKATEINPGDANLHVNLAVACYKLGETEKAKEQLLKAFALEPANRRAAELLKDIK